MNVENHGGVIPMARPWWHIIVVDSLNLREENKLVIEN